MLRYIIFTALLAFVTANNIDFTDCGTKEVKSVDVTECTPARSPAAKKCGLHPGEPIHIVINFAASSASKTAKLVLNQTFKGNNTLNVDTDACSGILSPTCPLTASTTYKASYSYQLPNLPNVMNGDALPFTGSVVGDDGKKLGCISVAMVWTGEYVIPML